MDPDLNQPVYIPIHVAKNRFHIEPNTGWALVGLGWLIPRAPLTQRQKYCSQEIIVPCWDIFEFWPLSEYYHDDVQQKTLVFN